MLRAVSWKNVIHGVLACAAAVGTTLWVSWRMQKNDSGSLPPGATSGVTSPAPDPVKPLQPPVAGAIPHRDRHHAVSRRSRWHDLESHADTPSPVSPPDSSQPVLLPEPIAEFKVYWDSMPEWRRARVLKRMHSEIGDLEHFKELSWFQKRVLELIAHKDAMDQYGTTYAPLAKFVIQHPDPDLLRQAFEIAQTNPGRDD